MLKLQFLGQPEQYAKLAPPSVTIGRDPKNHLVVDHESVSDFHAEINLEGADYFIIDLLSSRGTFVNDKQVNGRTALVAWDVIRVGLVELEINDPNARRPDQWALRAKSDLLTSRYFALRPTTVVGRDAACDLHIDNSHLSRKHAQLTIEDDHLRVTDLDSRNGTFINGERISEALANPGDEISFDRQTFVISGPMREEVEQAGEGEQTVLRQDEADETVLHTEDTDATRIIAEEATRIIGEVSAPKACLIEQGDSGQGDSVALADAGLVIGRSDASDLVIPDSGVSKRHAKVYMDAAQWVIEDLGSSNGIFVNGQREQRVQLRDGDLIRIGPRGFRFEMEQAATEIMDMDGTVVFSGSHTPPPVKETPKPGVKDEADRKPPKKPERPGDGGAGMPAWVMGALVFTLCVGAAVLIYMRRSGAL